MTTKCVNSAALVQPEMKMPDGGTTGFLSVPGLPARDSLTDERFDQMMEIGYDQAKSGKGLPVEDAFARIREMI